MKFRASKILDVVKMSIISPFTSLLLLHNITVLFLFPIRIRIHWFHRLEFLSDFHYVGNLTKKVYNIGQGFSSSCPIDFEMPQIKSPFNSGVVGEAEAALHVRRTRSFGAGIKTGQS